MYGYDVPLVSKVCTSMFVIILVDCGSFWKSIVCYYCIFGITTDYKDEQFLNALPPIIFVPSLILNDIKRFGMLISFEPSFVYMASFAHLSMYYSMSLLRIYLAKV